MLAILLAIPFVGALLICLLRTVHRGNPQTVALITTLAANALLLWLTLGWDPDAPMHFDREWIPMVGLRFSLWLDGPALFWAWLVLAIGLLVVQYARHYMDPSDAPWRFYSTLLAFLGSMLGVVIARNAILMFLFWEMTSITSFLLIGHWHHRAEARAGARRALLITSLGGLAMLMGLGFLYWIQASSGMAVTFEWDELWAATPLIVQHSAAGVALVLLLVGAFTKSAQFPFHVWLPGAMEAPTPVSAFLHAATMVKAGIYLLGRLYPIFESMDLWLYLVATVGVVTMLTGGFVALLCRDLKQLLAWSTVSQLGLITAYYGFGYNRVEEGVSLLALDLLLVASHALFKAGLFMVVGVVDHGTGTRDWMRLGGLGRRMPWSAAFMALGCASMAGAPLTLGFVSKKSFLDAAAHAVSPVPWLAQALYILTVVGGVLTTAYCLRLAVSPFYGKVRDDEVHDHAHEGSPLFLLAPGLLTVACLLAGLWVPLAEKPLAQLVRGEFFDTSTHYTIAFFHAGKFDAGFWISVSTLLLLGPALYLLSGKVMEWHRDAGSPAPFVKFWDKLLDDWLLGTAAATARFLQSPSLRRNGAIVLLVLVALVGVPLTQVRLDAPPILLGEYTTLAGLGFALFTIVLVLMVIVEWDALMRLLALGFVGLMVVGIFVVYRGGDLAITQMLVELVLLLMFLILLPRLNAPRKFVSPVPERIVAALVAIAVGLLVGCFTYFSKLNEEQFSPAVAGRPTPSEFYLTNAKSPSIVGGHSGGGTNVVNVILVDFRAMDTLGEVTVLLIAALGVGVLLKRTRRKPRGAARADHPEITIFTTQTYQTPETPRFLRIRPAGGQPLVLRRLSPLVTLLGLNFAAVLLLVGHNKPGGGFIAGLMTAAALVPYFLAFRREEAARPHFPNPLVLLPAGLLLALATGLVPVALGYEFLRSAHTHVHVPLLGELEFASAMAFDMGVYLLVVGVALFILRQFGRA